MTDIDSRIVAAAAALDADRPGWAAKINTDTLRQSNALKCVLGQVYGGYYNAPSELRRSHHWAFGGDTGCAVSDNWIPAIEQRLAPVKTVPVSDLDGIKSYEEFVAYRDKVTDREVTVTLKANDVRKWVDAWTGPPTPGTVHRDIYDVFKAALNA